MSSRLASAVVDPKTALINTIRGLARARREWEVFRDFVEVSAISLSNAVDLGQRDAREQRYLSIIKNYSREEASQLSACLAHLVNALEAGFGDPLGETFMAMGLNSHWHAQFFSPYCIGRMMAQMTAHDVPRDREFITVQEPAVGSGVMVIALAHALHDQHINYQQAMHVHAIDIDITAVHMAYVQFSLLHIPAVVIHGNGLTLEEWSHWKTPAHCLGFWDTKLARRAREIAPQASPSVEETTTARPPAPRTADITLPSQLSLI
jgi:hypothetical protein